MKSSTLSNLLMSAAVAGLIVGSTATAQQKQAAKKSPAKPATEQRKEKNSCRGKDGCKGKDGCNGKADSSKAMSNKAKSKDSCKGKDGCKGKDEKKKD